MKYNQNIEKYSSIWEILNGSVEKYKDRDLMYYKTNYAKFHKTYGEFYMDVKKLATYLNSIGLKKGDKAIIYLPSRPEWLQIMFACSLLGIILVPIDMDTKADPIKQIIAETNPKFIFQSRTKKIPGDHIFSNAMFVEDFYATIYKLEPISPRDFTKDIEPDDIFEILYTSGTTGKPKGVIITNKTITSNLYNSLLVFPIQEEMKALQILPFSHSFALIICIGIFDVGGTLSFVRNLTPDEIKTTLLENEVHIIAAVPLFLNRIKEGIELRFKKVHALPILNGLMTISGMIPSLAVRRKMFSFIHKQLGGNLKMIVSAGSYLHPETYKWWEKIGVMIIKGYGTTETGPVLSLDRQDDRDPYSIGYPIPNQQLKILDNEILVKGDHITPGYFKNQEKTKEVFTEDDWYKTGDFGFIKDEKLYFKGRQKNMIVLSNGMNVYPEDIENIFNQYEKITESCVVGIDKDGRGEEIFGVFLTEMSKEELNELIEKVNKEKLNSNQWIKDFYIWPEEDLPRTHTKKVKKNNVKQGVLDYLKGEKSQKSEESTQEDIENIKTKEISILYSILEDVTGLPQQKIKQKSNLVRDLSMDSLSRADLIAQVQKEIGKYIEESQITPETSVSDLVNLLESTDQSSEVRKPSKPSKWATKAIPSLFRNLIAYPIWNFVLFFFVKVKVNGEIPKDIDNFIMVANHRSNLDSILIARLLSGRLRSKTYVSASGFHWDETWRRFFRGINQLFILPIYTVNSKQGLDTMEKTAYYINNGMSVLVFPEGKLIYNKKKRNEFKKGAAKIIKEFQLPVLEFKTKGLDIIKPHMVLPRVGFNPITIDIDFKKFDHYKSIDEINEELKSDFEGY